MYSVMDVPNSHLFMVLYGAMKKSGKSANVNDQEHILTVTDVALPSGHGVSRLGEMVVFIPGTVTGDRVKVRIAKRDKRFAYGEVTSFETLSPDRTEARCADFGTCGGCDLQALDYDRQLEIKQNHLRQVLRRIGSADIDTISLAPIVPSVDLFSYRSKIEFAFGSEGKEATVGLRERVSPLHAYAGRVIPVSDCPLFGRAAAHVLSVFRDFLRKSGLRPGDSETGHGELQRLVVREAKGTGEVMINVLASIDIFERMRHFGFLEKVPSLKSLYITLGSRSSLVEGEAFIEDRYADLVYRIYPFSFFQPNPKTAHELYRRMIAAAGIEASDRVLGLYCGSGTIELFLSGHVKEVKGIDSSAQSISCAQANATVNHLGNCSFVRDKVERIGQRLGGFRSDVVVVDPPRAGLSRDALSCLLEIGSKKLVYISCNPATLARDLARLTEDYRATTVVPFDFFPHTGHFEVLTVLERIW
jgi:23S rRNA (uracil1939-C5)-methyltransferase